MEGHNMTDSVVLIVDDNPINLSVLSEYLTMKGCKVSISKNGEQALQRVERIKPDLILLDVMMPPGMNGFEVCRRLKANEDTQEIPVIFMTALSETVDKVKGFEAGGVDYITKPFQHEELLSRVNAHLAIRKFQQQLQETNRNLEETNKKLEEATLTDPLTGVRNRRYVSKFIRNTIAKVHRDYKEAEKAGTQPVNSDITFLILDLDHFKSVNDTYGHDAGDRVLVQVRDILESVCRDTDILVRWGGEEFLIISRYSNQHEAHIIAERIREKIAAHAFDIGNGHTISRTCSIGVASYPFVPTHPEALNWEQVVAIADQGLYAAKRSGRNAYVSIMSTEHTQPGQLFQRIQDDIEGLFTSGELQVLTSLPDLAMLMFQ